MRHIGCMFCTAQIFDLSSFHKSLVQLNTIPIFVHAEPFSLDVTKEFFECEERRHLYHIEDPDHKIYDLFGIGRCKSTRIFNLKTIKRRRELTKKGIKNRRPKKEQKKYVSTKQSIGVVLLEKGKVLNSYTLKSIGDK